MLTKDFSKNVHKITIYMGYGERGHKLRQEVQEALSHCGMSARDFLCQALKITYTPTKK